MKFYYYYCYWYCKIKDLKFHFDVYVFGCVKFLYLIFLKFIYRCVIQEFIDTEKHYVKDLETIVEVCCFLT